MADNKRVLPALLIILLVAIGLVFTIDLKSSIAESDESERGVAPESPEYVLVDPTNPGRAGLPEANPIEKAAEGEALSSTEGGSSIGSDSSSAERKAVRAQRFASRKGTRVSGRVRLSDGTPVSRMHIGAFWPEAVLDEDQLAKKASRRPGMTFAESSTDAEGRFNFMLDSAVHIPGCFELRQLNRPNLGQNDQLYPIEDATDIEHVIVGGQFVLKILEPSGEVVSTNISNRYDQMFDPYTSEIRGIRIAAEFSPTAQDSESASDRVLNGPYRRGFHQYFYTESSLVNITATRAYDGASGSIENLLVSPYRSAGEVTLQLVPLEKTGRIQVSVTDENGGFVSDYAVLVEAPLGGFGPRHYQEEDWGVGGVVEGLPLGSLRVELVNKKGELRWFMATGEGMTRTVEIEENRTVAVFFTVERL